MPAIALLAFAHDSASGLFQSESEWKRKEKNLEKATENAT